MIPLRGQVRGVRETIAAFGQMESLLRQAGMRAMTDSGLYLLQVIRDDFLQGPYPTFIERRTGSFRATWRRGHPENVFQVHAQGTQIVGSFGSLDKRARILNDGGVVRSSRPGGFLAIRTEFTRTGRGVVREKYMQPLRNIPNTFVVMGGPKGGRQARGTVFERIGRRIIPIAWLVKYVTIMGRHFAEKGSAKAEPGIQGIFRTQFETVLTRFQDTLRRIA
jgi:hypothetical protein